MSTALPVVDALTQRLLALESVRASRSAGEMSEAVRVCDKLRRPLARFVGSVGFASLLSRSLSLAKARVTGLEAVRVAPDGSLTGFDEVRSAAGSVSGAASGAAAPGAVVVSQLLGLLVTFIGEPLMLQLVWEAWPDALGNAGSPITEEKP